MRRKPEAIMIARMIAAPTQAGIVLLPNKITQAEHKFPARAGTRLPFVSPFTPILFNRLVAAMQIFRFQF